MSIHPPQTAFHRATAPRYSGSVYMLGGLILAMGCFYGGLLWFAFS